MRLQITIPDNDPRFAELREALNQARAQGRGNPASRMVVEWALMGFLFTHGKLGFAVPSTSNGTLPSLSSEASTRPGTTARAAVQADDAPPDTATEVLQESDIDALMEEAGWGFE